MVVTGASGVSALGVMGALGGVVVFIGGIWAVVRGVFGLTNATKENTEALKTLTGRVDDLSAGQNANSQRIARLEGRRTWEQ